MTSADSRAADSRPADSRPGAEAPAWWSAGGLTLAVALAYANSLAVPFLLDDPQPDVPLDYSTRPLVWGSFALNRVWSGGATWSYHVVNALVHLACGLLLLGVLRRASALATPRLEPRARDGLAFATALLWLIHPLQTATVTYLSQRAESLAAAFYLLTLYAFLRALTAARPLGWQALTLAGLALGFATKEIIATAPVVLWLFDATFVARGPLAALRRRTGFYGAIAATTLALAAVFIAPLLLADNPTAGLKLEAFGPLDYARTQAGVLLHYLRLVVWPAPLCFDYAWPIARAARDWMPQTAAIAALLVGTLVALRRRSWIGFAGACFFLVLAPSSSFLPIQDLAFEHRVYLALAAPLLLLVVALGWSCARFVPAQPKIPGALVLVASLACLGLTVRRNQDYRSAVRLFQRTIEQVPGNARAHANLGAALLGEGRVPEAIAALEDALRLDANIPYATMNLGKAYLEQGDAARAIPLMERAVASLEDPRFRDALASALYENGEPERAVPHFEQAVAANPSDAGLRYRLACAESAAGRGDAALASYTEALRLDPELAEAHVNLAALLLERGRTAEALQHSEQAVARLPDSFEAQFGRAQALRALGRFDEALTAFRAAARLAPERPEPPAGLAQTVLLKPAASAAERSEALAAAERASVLAGGEALEILLLVVQCQAAQGDFVKAQSTLARARALASARGDGAWTQHFDELAAELRRRAGK